MQKTQLLHLNWEQIMEQGRTSYGPLPLCHARLETVRNRAAKRIQWLAKNASDNQVFARALDLYLTIQGNETCRAVVGAAMAIENICLNQKKRHDALRFHQKMNRNLKKVAACHFI